MNINSTRLEKAGGNQKYMDNGWAMV